MEVKVTGQSAMVPYALIWLASIGCHMSNYTKINFKLMSILFFSFTLISCGDETPGNNNEPVFISSDFFVFNENELNLGYIALAKDSDGDIVTYSISGGVDQREFSINGVTGVMRFNNSPDYEIPTDTDFNNTYIVDITANDGSHTVTQRITVTVKNTNDNPPVFTSAANVTLDENTTVTGYVASATDGDGDALTYSLLDSIPENSNILIFGGIDFEKFSIDPSTGVLNFIVAPDFEVPEYAPLRDSYVVIISASDGLNTVYQVVTVVINNTNDNIPVFISNDVFNFGENTDISYITVRSTDADGDILTLSVTGGEDRDKFTLDTGTGVLSFLSVPDYEVPTDSGSNNTYVINVTVSDGFNDAVQSITVTIVNRNDNPPVFVSDSSVSPDENTTVTGYSALVTDADGDSSIFRLLGGVDANKFSINSNTGELSFINAPDFESPDDSDIDNTYIVNIEARNGMHTAIQTVAINVVDIFDLHVNAVDVKTLQFDWQEFSGATFYKLFVNPDGLSGYSVQIDNIAGISAKITVPVHFTDWVNATYIVEAFDESGVLIDTAAIGISSEMIGAIGYFKASNPGANDFFGYSVALSEDGRTLAVGSPDEEGSSSGVNGPENNLLRSGAVYVYSKSGMSWEQQAYIKANNPDFVDYFGRFVSLSADGNTLAVGSMFEDGGSSDINGLDNNLLNDAGAVYIFTRTEMTWSQQAYIKPTNPGENDWFGQSVSLSSDGNTLAVGAIKEDGDAVGINGIDNNALNDTGAVYIFSRDGIAWMQQAYVKASNPNSSDYFGQSVSLSSDGNTLAIGSHFEDGSSASINGIDNNLLENSGAVYIFSRSGAAWSQQAYVKANNPDSGDLFGNSISLSSDGNVLAVGAMKEIGRTAGIDEAINITFDNKGAVYLFGRIDTTWNQQTFFKASNPDIRGKYGASVSLTPDGNTLAVGSTNSEFNNMTFVGSAYVYKRNGLVWTQQAHIKASFPDQSDEFSISVSLSADGDTMAVGAFMEDGDAIGINGEHNNSLYNSGAVYLY